MPSPPINGIGTSMDTQDTIRKLLDVERQPLKRLEFDNERNQILIKAWEEVRKRTRTLADKSQALYSFSGAFATKSIISSDPGAVTGQAAPEMDNQDMQIEVTKLATHQRIHSAPVSPETELPAGNFSLTIGEKTIEYEFPGGKLPALLRVLKAKSVGAVDINMIRKDQESSILVFRSLTSGSKGKIEFKAAAPGPLVNLGLPPAEGGAAVVAEEAQDAVLKLHGVEVKRPSNENLTDILEGASLTLRKVTAGPVSLRVQANSEAIEKQIQDWVTAYNDLTQFCRDNSKTIKREEFERNRPSSDADISEGLRRLQAGTGVFAADSNIRQLNVTLQGIVSGSYPTTKQGGARMLADIGITSGARATSSDETNFGVLALDSDKLRAALSTDAASVKELFAMDVNEDAVIDNGVAFKIQQTLGPYNRMSGGLITSRIDLIKTQIADNKERIRKKEMSLVGKEQDLRRRFGRMESAIREGRSMSQSLNGLSRNGGE
ncbi:MAG: flagellar filament capping protein FliD [Spirochaetia bacterium]|nr:flagellar filament capping protein FliD [Spirochaetia bacterium]